MDGRQQLDRRESDAIIASSLPLWSSGRADGGRGEGEGEGEGDAPRDAVARSSYSGIIRANIYMNDRAAAPLTIRQRRHNV